MNYDHPLIQAALTTRNNAYCPYSKFQVGASLLTQNSKQIFSGCNVENVSYGATICAERNAVLNAIATLGNMSIDSLVVLTDMKQPAPPCGQCLQVISEFASPNTQIILANTQEIVSQSPFSDFLPKAFKQFS